VVNNWKFEIVHETNELYLILLHTSNTIYGMFVWSEPMVQSSVRFRKPHSSVWVRFDSFPISKTPRCDRISYSM